MTLGRQRYLVIGLAYAAMCVWVASFFGTWSDEEYSLATTAHGASYALHRAIDYELQAPLYFVLLSFWRGLDASVWFARLFSILCAGALFFVLIAIGRRIAPRRDPLPFALVAALNPFVVVAALQIRLYSLALLLSALLWLCYDAGFASGSSKRARAGFVLVAVAGIYTQYFIGFMLVGFAVGLAIARPNVRTLLAYVLACAVVGLAIIPIVGIAHAQAQAYAGTPLSHFSLTYQTTLHPWIEFLLPHLYSPVDETVYEHVFYLLVAIILAFCVVRSAPNITRRLVATVAVATTIELMYIVLANVVDQKLNDRYFIALFVPVATATYVFLRSTRADPPIPQRALATIMIVMTALTLASQYRYLAQNGDYVRVAAYLQSRVKPGDVIAVYTNDNLPALSRQYRGAGRTMPYPRPNPQDHYDIEAVVVHTDAEAEEGFTRLEPFDRLWFVDVVRCIDTPPTYGCRMVDRAVTRHFTVASRRQFYRNVVYELRPRSSAVARTK